MLSPQSRYIPWAENARQFSWHNLFQGVGRRYAFLVCRKADIDIHKRAGELSEEEMDKIATVMLNPQQYKIPSWFLNRQKDIRDGKNSQVSFYLLHITVSIVSRKKRKEHFVDQILLLFWFFWLISVS